MLSSLTVGSDISLTRAYRILKLIDRLGSLVSWSFLLTSMDMILMFGKLSSSFSSVYCLMSSACWSSNGSAKNFLSPRPSSGRITRSFSLVTMKWRIFWSVRRYVSSICWSVPVSDGMKGNFRPRLLMSKKSNDTDFYKR